MRDWSWDWKLWVLIGLVVLCVVVGIVDTWNLRRLRKQVLEILGRWGHASAHELINFGVPSNLVYVVLNQMERDGVVFVLFDKDGYKKYGVVAGRGDQEVKESPEDESANAR